MKADEKDMIAGVVVAILGGMVLATACVFVAGWAASFFWNMFAPPLFDAPQAELRNGIGIVGFLMCLRASVPEIKGR